MNIFTAIKYPVDEDFRIEDLKRIPTRVLEAWWHWSFYKMYGGENRARIPPWPERIHIYLNNSTRKKVRAIMLRKLKSMLEDYDNGQHLQRN